jgi:hypothetical protein
MKNILRDKLGRFKALGINLLDGQRRGEVVFRRVFLLVVLYILFILVGHLIFPRAKQEEVVQEVEAKDRVEWVGGDRVTYREDGIVEVVPAENFESAPEVVEIVETQGKGVDSVSEFIKSYGGRIDDTYLALLRENCNEEAVKIVVAISVAETSMGKKTNKATNFYGWFKSGNTAYDPSVEEMAAEICRGVQKSYMSIGKDARVTGVYTGSDRVDSWTENFNWALAQM